jgi:hypothetical protein
MYLLGLTVTTGKNSVAMILDPYNTLWCVFLRERPQVRFTELPLNTRLAASSRAQRGSVAGQMSVQSKLCPTSLASAPKRKLTIKCCMGFYGRQSPPLPCEPLSRRASLSASLSFGERLSRRASLSASFSLGKPLFLLSRRASFFSLGKPLSSLSAHLLQEVFMLFSFSSSGVVVSIIACRTEGCWFKSCCHLF